MTRLLRLAGRDTATLPRFPEELAQLVRQAKRVGGVHVPPPVPGGQATVPVTVKSAGGVFDEAGLMEHGDSVTMSGSRADDERLACSQAARAAVVRLSL